MDTFVNTLHDTLKIMSEQDIKYMSMGDKFNTKTGELISGVISNIDGVEWMYITNKINQTQFIIFPKSIRKFLLDACETTPWDTKHLFLDSIFSNMKKGITHNALTTQLEKKRIMNNKYLDNMIISYNKNENKINMCLSDINTTKTNIKIIVKSMNNEHLYNTTTSLSSNYKTWIKINNIEKHDSLKLEFHENDNLLTTKILNIKQPDLSELHPITIKTTETDEFVDLSLKSDKKSTNELYIISAYPNTSKKYEITKKCIQSLKKDNKKILISSHIPIDSDLQNMVDYYIYDEYNPLIEHTLYNNFWYDTKTYRADILFKKLAKNNILNQSLTALNNIENSIRLAKLLGFKRIINITYDYILSDNDIKTINNLSRKIDNNNKEGYFIQFSDNNLDTFKTVFFIIDIDLYLELFTNPRTAENFNKECKFMNCDNFLERYFYKKLENYQNRILIEHTTEDKIFDGKINIFSGVEYLTYIPVENEPYTFMLWLSTNNILDNRKMIVDYFNNDNLINIFEHNIENKTIFYKPFYVKEHDNIKLKIKFIDNQRNEILERYEIGPINRNNFNIELSDKGNFLFKNKNYSSNDTKPIKSIKENHPKIATIINYTTKDYNNLKYCIDNIKELSNVINICICDHLYDGTPENMEMIQKTYDEYHKNNVNFIQYEYDDGINKNEKYWKNISRLLGKKYLKDIDWLLFIDSNEIIINKIFSKWIKTNKLDKDFYLFTDEDSPLLIKNNEITFVGDRMEISKSFNGNGILNIENKLKTKFYIK